MLSKVLLMVMGVFMMNADYAEWEAEQQDAAADAAYNAAEANVKPVKKSLKQKAESEFDKLKKKI